MAETISRYFSTDTLVIDGLTVEFSPPALPPNNKITNVTVSDVTENSVTLNWGTEKPTIYQIKFQKNLCPSEGCEISNNFYDISHTKKINGLQPNTEYSVIIIGITNGAFIFQSDEIKFKTLQTIVIPPPVIPPVLPKILQVNNSISVSSYSWNTEQSQTFAFNLKFNPETEYVKYYFKNQPNNSANGSIKLNVVNNSVTIVLQNPNEIGIFDIAFVPGNNIVGDGEITYKQVNVFKEKFVGVPDIRNIEYTKNIIEADLKPQDFYIYIDVQTENSENLILTLGSIDSSAIIEIPIQTKASTKISLYGKELLSTYKNRIIETENEYIFNFFLQTYNNGFLQKVYSDFEQITITVVKTKFVITLEEALNKLSEPFSKLFSGNDTKKDYEDKIKFEDDKHLYYRARFQDETTQDSFIITNIATDNITYSLNGDKVVKTEFVVNEETGNTERVPETPYPTLVVKLLEPLPKTIDTNALLWINKQIIPTVVEDVIITDTDEDKCIELKPNFSVDVLDEVGYEYYSQLISSGSNTSTDIVNTFLSSSNFDLTQLNIEYTSGSNPLSDTFLLFDNFINFSGAETRLDNFQYKLESIEFYNQKISSSLYIGSTASTSSYSILTSQSLNSTINEIKNKFDGLEKTLYTDFSITSSNAIFFETQKEYANLYDRENKNYLVRHMPSYIKESGENDEFLLFLEMIGQHFDVLWAYIKGIDNTKKITNKSTDGVSDNLVFHLLENFGWDPGTPFKSTELWKEAFGTTSDGDPYENTNLLGNSINSNLTTNQARNQVWRRILNNLPYLLKHKGTRRSINAIMSCYGVPSSLLTIVEFGGPGVKPLSSSQYTYDDRTAAINLSETEYITVPWNVSPTYAPTAVQTRFKTSYKIPKSTSVTGSQLIRKERTGGGYWQVNVVPNFTSSFGDVVFTLKNSTATETISLSVTQSVLFDDFWKNVTIQKERFVSNSVNYDRFDLYVKEGLDDRIIMNHSVSAIHTASVVTDIFTDSGNLYINARGATKGISGSFDEVRIWNSALSESVVTAHALNPDVIYGNGIYSSTDNLLVRLDFEWPKDRIADPYIKNVSPSIIFNGSTAISGYIGYATASITTTAANYPYQYEVYERTVSATIPSIGFVPNDKVRFENIELVTNLSHKARATQKAYDRAPIDSNRLGLFFSPVKELNLDILKSLGPINIGDYIGDWRDEYGTDRYKDLDSLRNYYFKRTNLSFEEYIKLIKSVDKSLFDMLKQVIPARAKVTQGLLLEPSVLERSKIKITKPLADNIFYTSSIDTQNNILLETEIDDLSITLNTSLGRVFSGSISNLSGDIDITGILQLQSTKNDFTSSINANSEINLSGNINRNSTSTMGGFEVIIDAERTSTLIGEYEQELGYETAGMDNDSPFNKGFGLVGQNGFVDRTYFKNDGTLILTERKNAYLLTVKYTRDIPSTNLSGTTTYEKIDKFKKKLVLVDSEIISGTTVKTATNHSFYTNIVAALGTYPYDKGVVIEIIPFDGLTYGHYRFVGDLTKGLQNSFYEGSKQTSLTTVDGTPAVEVFATNPNRLKVSDSGRGSGEPILEVE